MAEGVHEHAAVILEVLRAHYGGDARRWLFFLACEELLGYAGGAEWGVGHYRLAKVSVTEAGAT